VKTLKRWWLVLLFLLVGLTLVWAAGGEPEQVRQVTALPAMELNGTPLGERRQAVFEYPAQLAAGEDGVVRLRLEPLAGSGAQEAGVYADYNLLVSARMELIGADVAPGGTVSIPQRPGRPVEFRWQFRMAQDDVAEGRVWVHLKFIPLNGGVGEDRLLLVPALEVERYEVWGFKPQTLRLVGWLALALAVVLAAARGVPKRR